MDMDVYSGREKAMTGLKRQAASGVKWNSIAAAVKISVQLITLAILARLLHPEDFGLMSMAVVIIGFAQAFADFGLSNAIIYRQDATRQQLSSLYWLNLTVGLILFCILWLMTPLVVKYYQEPSLKTILHWLIGVFLIIPFGQQFQSLLRRELRFRTLSIIQIIANISYAVVAISLALVGMGVMSLVWGALARAAITSVSLISVAIQSHWLPLFHFRRLDLRGFVGFGFFQMGERTLNYLANNVDYLIIGRFLGPEALGYYTLAYNLMRMPLTYINPIVVSVAFPTFARVQNQDDLLRQGYSKILHYLSMISFPLMAGMFSIAPIFVPVIYGAKWVPIVHIVQIFCLLGAFKSMGNLLGSILLAKGRADLGFYMNVISILGYSVSNFLGVRWGIMGVAVSSLLFTVFVLFPVDFILRWKLIHMNVREYLLAIRIPLLASLVMLFLLVVLERLLISVDQSVTALTILVFAGGAIYGGLLWFFDYPFVVEAWRTLKVSPARRI